MVVISSLWAALRRRLVRAWWLARYWVLWKHRRVVLALCAATVPAGAGFGVAHWLYAQPAPAADAPVLAFGWVGYLVIIAVAAVISLALAPRPQEPQAQEAKRPVVEDGAGVVRIYGDVWIDDPVLLGWWQVGMDPIKAGGKK